MSDRRGANLSDVMGSNASLAQELENLDPEPALEHLAEKFERQERASEYLDNCVGLPIARIFDDPENHIKIDNVLPGLSEKDAGVIVAPGATGKSFLSIQTAISIAGGYDFFNIWGGFEFKSGRSLYINKDDSWEQLLYRTQKILQDVREYSLDGDCRLLPEFGKLLNEQTYEQLLRNLDIRVPGDNDYEDLHMIERDGNDIVRAPIWESFVERERYNPPRLLNVDTLDLAAPDFSDSDDVAMTKLLETAKWTSRRLGCPVLFNHHTSKYAQLNDLGSDSTASRGSTKIVDNARWVLNMQTMPKKDAESRNIDDEVTRKSYVHITSSKVNYSSDSEGLWLRRCGNSGFLLPHAPPPVQHDTKKNGNGKSGSKKKNGGGLHVFEG